MYPRSKRAKIFCSFFRLGELLYGIIYLISRGRGDDFLIPDKLTIEGQEYIKFPNIKLNIKLK